MNDDRAFERATRDWLEAGSDRTPSPVIDAVLLAVRTTPQERGLGIPWRTSSTTKAPGSSRPRLGQARLAVAAVAAVLLIAMFGLLGSGSLGPTSSPILGATPSAGASSTTSPPASTGELSAPLGYPGPGVIAFTRHNPRGGDDLYLIDPSGANERLVVPGGCCALISPDGGELAVGVAGGGLLHQGTTLVGINVYPQPGSAATTTIPSACGGCAIARLNATPDAWSLDGSQVAIDVWSNTDPTQDGMAIAARTPSEPWIFGTGALAGPAHRDIPIAFSPDGKQLLFFREERTEGPTSIGPLFLLTIADRTARQLTAPNVTLRSNGMIQGTASWSRDGSKIAFTATDTSAGTPHTNVYLTGPSLGASVTTVVADATGATSARFSPDGSWIAYDRASSGSQLKDLHLVHPDGSGDRNLTSAFDPGVCCGQWSPDGAAVLVAAAPSDDVSYDLFIVPLEGQIRQVTQSRGTYAAFVWGSSPP